MFSISICRMTAKMDDALHTLRIARLKAIRGKVISTQVLSVVVRWDIIDMTLITLLDVIEEEVIISHGEDDFLHSIAHLSSMLRILIRDINDLIRERANLSQKTNLIVSRWISASQQCMKNDDGLI